MSPGQIKSLVDRFLAWPLPKTVCSDLCVTMNGYEHMRSGTNLLTENEVQQMMEYLFPDEAPAINGSPDLAAKPPEDAAVGNEAEAGASPQGTVRDPGASK